MEKVSKRAYFEEPYLGIHWCPGKTNMVSESSRVWLSRELKFGIRVLKKAPGTILRLNGKKEGLFSVFWAFWRPNGSLRFQRKWNRNLRWKTHRSPWSWVSAERRMKSKEKKGPLKTHTNRALSFNW